VAKALRILHGEIRTPPMSVEGRKAARLESAGWKTVTVQGFLGLSDEDMAIIEVKVALATRLRAQRKRAGMSQLEVARIVRSSQPRVAKMEAADKSVSIDLLVKALVKTGVSVQEIGRSLEKITPSKVKTSRAQRLAHA
jgi:predicted XRE-type DNA-binding protein